MIDAATIRFEIDQQEDTNMERSINIDIEREWVRILISHGKDEEIVKLTIKEAKGLLDDLKEVLEDYEQRRNVRID